MQRTKKTAKRDDPYKLDRFVKAQEPVYARALAQLQEGRKMSHWMWFIFPQLDGIGQSATAKFYAIRSLGEAEAYLQHPVLGERLMECCETLLLSNAESASEIFGYPDDVKLSSSMTLFARVSGPYSVFSRVLDRFFDGQQDPMTLELLGKLPASDQEENPT